MPVDPAHPHAYGGALIRAYYTHSVVRALGIDAVTRAVASHFWEQCGGAVFALVIFSHWALDLLVHRPDLPILPGNAGNLPLLGLGLWRQPVVSAMPELALVLGGVYLYYRSTMQLPTLPGVDSSSQRRCMLTIGITIGAFLLLLSHYEYTWGYEQQPFPGVPTSMGTRTGHYII